MWYAILCEDIENSLERRKAARPAHVERIRQLADEGRVLVAGPHPALDCEDPWAAGFTGSLMILDFPDLAAAEAWAAADPYVEAGVFATVKVKPFKKVLP